ncbi:MAG: 3-hydroxyacyl-ACP dehydratase FabZ [bacterium]
MTDRFPHIKELLPQRFPFLLVDDIIGFEPDTRIVCLKNITYNESFFQGHFPQKPIMPGALILEALAQTCIIFFKLSQATQERTTSLFLFGGVKAKFKKPVVPGDVLIMEMMPVTIISTGGIMKGCAKVNDEIVTKAELSFALR